MGLETIGHYVIFSLSWSRRIRREIHTGWSLLHGTRFINSRMDTPGTSSSSDKERWGSSEIIGVDFLEEHPWNDLIFLCCILCYYSQELMFILSTSSSDYFVDEIIFFLNIQNGGCRDCHYYVGARKAQHGVWRNSKCSKPVSGSMQSSVSCLDLHCQLS